VVLMDEPFSGLDARTRHEVRRSTLAGLREANTAVVIVTRDPEEAVRLGDRVALMREGHIVQEGTPAEIYRASRDPQAAALFGGANIFHARAHGGHADSPFGLTSAPAIHDGDWAEIIYRGAAIRVAEQGIPARVISVRPYGAGAEIEAAIEGALLPTGMEVPAFVRVLAPLTPALSPGARIYLAANPAEAFVFSCLDTACRG
jgi:iron(III) transport system ATP-binding protein